ncbi:DUF6572 domain-containing protein [Bacillus thuringiensis]|uniref:Uncharacterized protein n=1 Tax=Bacillus thuringiensis serovar andalousiensis TaxID=257985 RepID=A0A6H0TIU5_BACTU|nr:DUF6572 domain-containing protein [Bacillus thuringiensis]QIW20483.1 hypothetical protein EVG22_19495 [Bacillus thuringiensis serovar andalousiensis]
MGLRDLDEVDFMGYDKDEKIAYLVIDDEEDWKDEEKHVDLLEEKINLYLEFIEGGEVYERYPEVKGYSFVIKIFGKYRCTKWGKEFLEKVDEILVEAGYGFQYVHKPYDKTKQTNNVID